MKKIALIIQREYLVRVRKRSFIIMTLLTPLIFCGMIFLPLMLSRGFENDKVIEVLDQTGKVVQSLENQSKLVFQASEAKDLESAKKKLEESEHYALLFIPEMDFNAPEPIEMFGKKSISIELERDVENEVERVIEEIRFKELNINKELIERAKAEIDFKTQKLSGESDNSRASTILGFFASFVIYIAVLIYAQQVMRGVVEEKTSRIIEVMISSVKPFQLMLGKILGVAAISITQFLLWIILTFGLIQAISPFVNSDDLAEANRANQVEVIQNDGSSEIQEAAQDTQLEQLLGVDFGVSLGGMVAALLFYFIGGYLLYSALFAAVGSAADNDTDTQQFVFPISMPLIIAFVSIGAILRDPDGPVAFWMSIVPFTSPIVMMMRLPFGGVAAWELILSMLLLVGGFVFITWVAARIYRIGILMYGKKVTFKEIGKWVFYKT